MCFINIKNDLVRLDSILRITHKIISEESEYVEATVVLNEINQYEDFNVLEYKLHKEEYQTLIKLLGSLAVL